MSSVASSFRGSGKKGKKGGRDSGRNSGRDSGRGGGGSLEEAGDPKLREAFTKYSRNGTTVKLGNLDKICNGALELGLSKKQIDNMLDHVETDGTVSSLLI